MGFEFEEEKVEVEVEERVNQSASAQLQNELKGYQKETRLFYNVDTKCKVTTRIYSKVIFTGNNIHKGQPYIQGRY